MSYSIARLNNAAVRPFGDFIFFRLVSHCCFEADSDIFTEFLYIFFDQLRGPINTDTLKTLSAFFFDLKLLLFD